MATLLSWDIMENRRWKTPFYGGGPGVEETSTEVTFTIEGSMECEYCSENPPDFIIIPIPNTKPSKTLRNPNPILLCESHYNTHIFKVFGGGSE